MRERPEIWRLRAVARRAPGFHPSPGRSLATAILALLAITARPAPALARAPRHQRSTNWAGYSVTARSPFTAVSGSWLQPYATCNQHVPSYSAFWVGLGGFKQGSHALEQIGTEVDCTATGHPRTYAWYELVPAPPVKLSLKVRPGERFAARVAIRGRAVTLRIQNLTTGQSFTRTVSMPSPDLSSAEWIAEAPSECISANQCQPLPLADFGTVQFTSARARTLGGHVGTVSDRAYSATELTLAGGGSLLGPGVDVSTSGSSEATPSALSHDGDSFAVSVKQRTLPPAPPPFAAGDQLRHLPRAPASHERPRAGSGR
jgi:hypothetical protein